MLRDELGTTPGPAVMARPRAAAARRRPAAGRGARRRPASRPARCPTALAAATARHAFVGREEALGGLHEAWDAAVGDERRLVAARGRRGDRQVAPGGRVHAHGPPRRRGRPLRALRRDRPGRLPADARDAARLVGRRRAHRPRPAARAARRRPRGAAARARHARRGSRRSSSDAGIERQRLFDALAALLAEIAAGAPLLLVFDDLQWADSPTLQLLRHLIRAPQPRRTMFLGTYREAELGEGHPLPELIASLRREGMLTHVPLDGLARGEVAELVAALGAEAPPDFVSALHGETEGNPFFVEEIVRHGGDLEDAGVPEGVREVTVAPDRAPARERARGDAGRLRDRARVRLRAARGARAAVGRRARLRARRGGRGEACSRRSATASGATPSPTRSCRRRSTTGSRACAGRGCTRGSARRSSPATRTTSTRGCRSSRATSRAPRRSRARRGRSTSRSPPAAAPTGCWRGRRRRSTTAARCARARRRAPRATAPGGELLLALGASEARAGLDEARGSFATALEVARELADPALLARAALGVAGPWSTLGREDPEVVAVLEEALGGLGEEDSPLRARLLARLSLELYYAGQPERRMALSEEAVAIARRHRRPRDARAGARRPPLRAVAARRTSTSGSRWPPSCGGSPRRPATSSSSWRARAGPWSTCSSSATWPAPTSRSTPRRRSPPSSSGRSTSGGRRCSAARARSSRASSPRPSGWRARRSRSASAATPRTPSTTTRWRCSTSAASRAGWARSRTRSRASSRCTPRSRPGAARRRWLHVELGRPDAAREAFEVVAAPGFDALPRDANWLIALTLAAEVCAALGDAERARELYDLLAPHGGRNVLVGRAASCNGCASRLLGMLASVLGEWDEAERRFFEAREMHVRMGARPFLARTELAWAEMLLARGRARRRRRRPRAARGGDRDRRRARDGGGGRARPRARGGGRTRPLARLDSFPMPRPTTRFVCSACGHSSAKWMGQCPGCGEWNTLTEEVAAPAARGRAAARAERPSAARSSPSRSPRSRRRGSRG